jgi:hypothetical protein
MNKLKGFRVQDEPRFYGNLGAVRDKTEYNMTDGEAIEIALTVAAQAKDAHFNIAAKDFFERKLKKNG